jgi:hypothetical protein
MRQIVQSEIARREQLFNAALMFFHPITQAVQAACDAGAKASLTLHAPADRNAEQVRGTLLCRSFHTGVGRKVRRYDITIFPQNMSCLVSLDYSKLSEDDYYEKRDDPQFVWECTYSAGKGSTTIQELLEKIEEALITDAVERRGKLQKLRISSPGADGKRS